MRAALAFCLLVTLSYQGFAANLSSTPPPKSDPGGIYHSGGRTGGDTAADAVLIPSALPYSDNGNTCGFANDYDAVCPYTGSVAPDVVYRFEPTTDESIQIDLCASQYDTKVYVWEDTPGNVIACNDDAACGYSGYQSKIRTVGVQALHTYYIVLDGYAASCGSYSLLVDINPPCVLDCPPGAMVEGEPPCQDNYQDYYNSGCGGPGNYDYQPIPGQADGCATMCGKSCTYHYQGLSYRDTDWFTVTAAGSTISAQCVAEFPLEFILIYNADCSDLQYDLSMVEPCVSAQLDHATYPGQEIWLWVGAQVFSGIPESDYILHVCGITPADQLAACCLADGTCVVLTESACSEQQGSWNPGSEDCDPNPCPPVPTQESSWGLIKNGYR